MNQNDYNNAQGQGYGVQPDYPAGSYPGGRAFQGYQQPQQQAYQPQQPGYQPQQPGYQPQQAGYQPTQRVYQTPQVTGSQPVVGGQNGYQQTRNTGSQPPAVPYQGAYQNPYAQQNYPQGVQGYPGQGGYPQGNGYPQTAGQGNIGYSYPGNQAPGASYIPQTPYQQPYNTQGYQPVGYGQGYNAYGQMGRGQQVPVNMPPETSGQMPLNGGGYVPQPVPVRRKPFVMSDTDLLVLGAILLILFALGMFVPTMGFLKWVFLILAAATTVLLWIKPLIARNKTICYTIVFALLAVVTVIGFVSPKQGNVTQPAGQVLSQTPEAGTKASPGSEITLVVSNGEGKHQVSVPDLRGLTEDEARSKLENNGLYLGSVDYEISKTYAKGQVIDQQYAAGNKIDEGTSVSVVISTGTSSTISYYVDYAAAQEEVFYMTVTVTDDNEVLYQQQRLTDKDGVPVDSETKVKDGQYLLEDEPQPQPEPQPDSDVTPVTPE